MTSMRPSPSVTDKAPGPTEDPLLEHRSRSRRFWVTLAILTTLLAVTVGVLAWALARQEAWTPIPIPTASPGY
ncbi:hypothetical protein B0O41_2800 [Propionibacteriaceae bacterium ES.041]|nr:hypothetical protein B0O41_2800 [Propionibacteriaceae bacterium ES.041]TDO93822.1 hypothetical protein C8D81_1617 [Enemella evansiae]